MEYIWNIYGCRMEYMWLSCGIYVVVIWNICCCYMEHTWNIYGCYMEYIWLSYGIYVVVILFPRSGDMLDKTHGVVDGSECLLEWVCGLSHGNIDVTKNVNKDNVQGQKDPIGIQGTQ